MKPKSFNQSLFSEIKTNVPSHPLEGAFSAENNDLDLKEENSRADVIAHCSHDNFFLKVQELWKTVTAGTEILLYLIQMKIPCDRITPLLSIEGATQSLNPKLINEACNYMGTEHKNYGNNLIEIFFENKAVMTEELFRKLWEQGLEEQAISLFKKSDLGRIREDESEGAFLVAYLAHNHMWSFIEEIFKSCDYHMFTILDILEKRHCSLFMSAYNSYKMECQSALDFITLLLKGNPKKHLYQRIS